jgi:peptidyl-prolyl cis-trans isomerase C
VNGPRADLSAWKGLCSGLAAIVVAAASGVACSGCHRPVPADQRVVAHWSGGVVTQGELRREASKMPPALRQQFESEGGKRDLAGALVDRRLLVDEARRRGLAKDPEIRRQIEDLESRLIVRALLVREEKQLPPPSEAEIHAFYEAHARELAQPARARLLRVLAAVAPSASSADRARARARAQGFLQRLRAGEPPARVAAQGDGPERAKGGELGLLVERSGKDPALEQAALALKRPGELSGVVACAEGFAVLQLLERRDGHVPSLEEASGDVRNRMDPLRKRKALDELLSRLRRESEVRIEIAAGPR